MEIVTIAYLVFCSNVAFDVHSITLSGQIIYYCAFLTKQSTRTKLHNIQHKT